MDRSKQLSAYKEATDKSNQQINLLNLILILILIIVIILIRVVFYLNKNTRVAIDNKKDDLSNKKIININILINLI